MSFDKIESVAHGQQYTQFRQIFAQSFRPFSRIYNIFKCNDEENHPYFLSTPKTYAIQRYPFYDAL